MEPELKTTLQVWHFLRDALRSNYESLSNVQHVANELLHKLQEVQHSVNSSGDYVVLSTSKTVTRSSLES